MEERIEKAESALPCPFCGGDEVYAQRYEHHEGAYRWRVLCAECMGQVDTGTWQQQGCAIDAWNRRAS